MRTIEWLLFVAVASGCTAKQGAELTLRSTPQSLSIEVDGNALLGSVAWGMSVPENAPSSDWLHIEGTTIAAPTTESKLNQVVMDVPLRGLGQWDGSNLSVSYEYKSYRDTTELGVAHLYKASVKSWQLPSADGEGMAPAQEAKDEDGAPSASNTESPPDFIDGFDRYVVRAVSLKYSATGNKIGGSIALFPDNGQLPTQFDPALDLHVKVEGTVQSFQCTATRGSYVAETGVEVLEPSTDFDPACLARFHLD